MKPGMRVTHGQVLVGISTGAHSLGETFDAKDSWRGSQHALLLAVSLPR